jgi:hypothetical protein
VVEAVVWRVIGTGVPETFDHRAKAASARFPAGRLSFFWLHIKAFAVSENVY